MSWKIFVATEIIRCGQLRSMGKTHKFKIDVVFESNAIDIHFNKKNEFQFNYENIEINLVKC